MYSFPRVDVYYPVKITYTLIRASSGGDRPLKTGKDNLSRAINQRNEATQPHTATVYILWAIRFCVIVRQCENSLLSYIYISAVCDGQASANNIQCIELHERTCFH